MIQNRQIPIRTSTIQTMVYYDGVMKLSSFCDKPAPARQLCHADTTIIIHKGDCARVFTVEGLELLQGDFKAGTAVVPKNWRRRC